jgi:hypothetical protein
MATETIYPKDFYNANNDPFENSQSSWMYQDSAWYRELIGLPQYTYFRGYPVMNPFGEVYGGIGANRADSGATEVWIGKTQTWTAATARLHVSGATSGLNDTTVSCYVYNHDTQVDLIHSISNDGNGTLHDVSFALDVADWGTDFVDIVKTQLRFALVDGGVDANNNLIRLYEFSVTGAYAGGGTLNSHEVPQDWDAATIYWLDSVWEGLEFGLQTGWYPNNTRFMASNPYQITDDPEMTMPPANSGSWTDHTNGKTPTQAFFVVEHTVVGLDNDVVYINVVEGATPTFVETVYSQVDGAGTFVETSANITTPADWKTHALSWGRTSTTGMQDTITWFVSRVWADVEFPGDEAGGIRATATASLDSIVALNPPGGPILIGGFPYWITESDVILTESALSGFLISAQSRGRLDGGSDYATTNGLTGCYLSGAWNFSASATAKLDALCGQRVNSATISDTTIVTYQLVLLDVTGLLPAIELPCSRANVTSRNGSVSIASFTVPDVDTHIPLINTRLDGTLVLRATLQAQNGDIEFINNIVQVNIDSLDLTRTGTQSEIVISGSKPRTFGAGKNWLIQTEGNSSEGVSSGSDFISTLHDPRIRPGDLIDIRGLPQAVIKEIQLELRGDGTRAMTLVPV